MNSASIPNVRIQANYRNRGENFPMSAIDGGDLTEGQAEKAAAFGATHYFRTADMKDLPKYKREALKEAGWEYTKIGHTSYKSATWGARRIA